MRHLHIHGGYHGVSWNPSYFFDIVKGTPALNLINAALAAVYNIGISAAERRPESFSAHVGDTSLFDPSLHAPVQIGVHFLNDAS